MLVDIDPYDARNQKRFSQIESRGDPAFLSHIRTRLGQTAKHGAETPLLSQLRIHVVHADAYGFHRGALQIEIERSVNTIRTRLKILVLKMRLQLVVHQVHEIRRFGGFSPGGNQTYRSIAGFSIVALRDEAVLAHQAEHQVTPFAHAVGMPERIVITRALHQARQHGRLLQCQLADVFSKIGLRRFTETTDVERAPAAEIDLIAVKLEYLLLVELLFQFQRDQELSRLAPPAFVIVQPETTGDLHAQSRSTLGLAAFFQVHISGSGDAQRVEAGVLKEALVFGRDNGIDQQPRNIRVVHDAPLLAVTVVKIGNKLRLELELAAVGIVLKRDDFRNSATGELDDAGLFPEIGLRAGENLDGVRTDVEPTHGVAARIAIAGPMQR